MRGSRSFWHRKRAHDFVPRMRSWNTSGKTGLAGTVGYKAGMTHALVIEDLDNPMKGQEVIKAVTVVEVPPLFVYSVSAYRDTPYGIKKTTEIPALQNVPKEIKRTMTLAKKAKMKLEDLEKQAGTLADVRLVCCTQPWKAGIKKTPEVFEAAIAGKNVEEKIKYAAGVLGKEVRASDVFSEGDYADVVGVTTGKGWQGVVKRFGVALNPRKATQSRRKGGALGGETQAKIMYTIPRAGQTGFHRRTAYNKRIIRISDSSKSGEVTPNGGFLYYGTLKTDFVLFEGSLQGPPKRPLTLRRSIRGLPARKPTILKISTQSKSG